MTIKLTEEKYKKLKKDVAKNREILEIDHLNVKEKEKQVVEHADTLIFNNDEEKQLYIANFLIPNDKKFYETYLENGKNLKKCAEAFGVSTNIILARAFEFGKYQDYMSKVVDEMGEKVMNEVEIIDAFSVSDKSNDKQIKNIEKYDEDDTLKAINKINQLVETNCQQEEMIVSQAKKIDNQSNEIISLKNIIKEKESNITELRDVIKKNENKILEYEKVIKDIEAENENYRKMVKELTPYMENYKKIIGFLDKSAQKLEN